MTIVAGTLDARQAQHAYQQAKAIVDAAGVGAVRENQFVFLANFDGTRNDRYNVGLSGNPMDTNVAQIFLQADKAVQANPEGNLGRGYYKGHGTEGSLVASDWYPGQVTQEAINTAKRAYNEFAEQATAWLKARYGDDARNHVDEIAVAITAFSRGCATAAVFTHLLYRDGLIDPETKEVWIPPGEVGVSAGVLFDPVTTGVNANVALAPNVKNVVVIQAQNEYRYLFKGVDYSDQPGILVLEAFGNHCNIGGGYDNGLGALNLEAATRFLQRSGVPIADVDPSRRFDSSVPLKVYDESDRRTEQENFLTTSQSRGKWDVSATFVEGAEQQSARLLDRLAKPAMVDYRANEEVENFTLYDRQVLSKVRSYLEDAPEVAVEKHPDLAGVLAARAALQNEIAHLPQQGQAVVVGRFDENVIGAIEQDEMPALQFKGVPIEMQPDRQAPTILGM